MSKFKIIWRVFIGLVYIGVVVAVLSVATSRCETVVLAGLVQLYTAVLYNFTIMDTVAAVNNYAGFVRFRLLAAAQGITSNEDGSFADQEKALLETSHNNETFIRINNISNAIVSLYAIYKIIAAVV